HERSNALSEADNARQQERAAEKATDQARAEQKETRRALAHSMVLLADAAWREGHAALAQERLDAVPGEVRRWEWYARTPPTQGSLFPLYGHAEQLPGVAFSPAGQRLPPASYDGTAKVWDARTGQPLLSLEGHMGDVLGVAFSPDGQRLATAG